MFILYQFIIVLMQLIFVLCCQYIIISLKYFSFLALDLVSAKIFLVLCPFNLILFIFFVKPELL